MIEELLAPGVVGVDVRGDCLDAALHPAEEALAARCVEARRREFTTGRACARLALARLGHGVSPVGRGERGEPQWPDGTVGSITHCADYRAAAVARAVDLAAIGIDAEPDEPLPEDIVEYIVCAAERRHLADLNRSARGPCWDRLVFSAKESVYKAWFPLARRWLGFEDAAVTIDPTEASFQARLAVPGPVVAGRRVQVFTGRWLARDGLVLTTVTLPAPGARAWS